MDLTFTNSQLELIILLTEKYKKEKENEQRSDGSVLPDLRQTVRDDIH